MEEVKNILTHYGLGVSELADYTNHSHDPDMWSHTFSIDGKKYIFVEVEVVGNDLDVESYQRLKEDLNLEKENLKLVRPSLEQMETEANSNSIGIDGHKTVVNADDGQEFKNPNGLDTETTWILFELS